MSAGLTALLLSTLLARDALAGKEESVRRLLALGRPEAAQRRCGGASLPSAATELREACAEAYWTTAVKTDTLAGWVRFQQDWAGTRRGADGFEQEARLALRELGEDAPEHHYQGWLDRYGTTGLAPRAEAHMARAGISAALADPSRIPAAVSAYRDHPDLVRLVERWPERFARVSVRDDVPAVTLDPPMPVQSFAAWAAAAPDGSVIDWAEVAILHLLELGLPREVVDALEYPPCPVPGWVLGASVTVGARTWFQPLEGSSACRSVALQVRDGHVVALQGIPLAAPDEPAVTSGNVLVPLAGPPGPPVLVGTAVQHVVGSCWLVIPLTGAIPYFTSQSASGLPLTPRLGVAEGDVVHVSQVLATATNLPVSALAAEPVFRATNPTPIEMGPLTRPEVKQVASDLATQGIPLVPARAWKVTMTGPSPQLVVEGTLADRPVRAVLNAERGVWRAHVWEGPPGEVTAFRWSGRGYVGWRSKGQPASTLARHEWVHFDDRGLVREAEP